MQKIMIFVLLMTMIGAAFACTTYNPMTFEDATSHADLIILGQKVAQSPNPTPLNPNPGNWMDIQINSILKGSVQSTQIRLDTNDECGNAFMIMPNQNQQLLMLKYNPTTVSYERVTYSTSIADSYYSIDNNNIAYYDIYAASWKEIPLQNFILQNNFTPKSPAEQIRIDVNINPDVNINAGQLIPPVEQITKKSGSTLAKLIPLSKETIIVSVVIVVLLIIAIAFAVTKARYDN